MAFDDTVPIKPLDPNHKPAAKNGTEAKKAETVADTVPLKPLDPNYKPPAKEAAKKADTPPPRIEPTLKAEPAAKVEPVGFRPETAAQAWLGALAPRGTEYLVVHGGTDFGPVVEAYAKGQELGWRL